MMARTYADLREHLTRLDEAGLLQRIDERVCKDTQMHPLVRWQFRGGIAEKDRKAFLFTNVVGAKGRHFKNWSVAVGAIATNPEIYRLGMNVPTLDDIGPAWERAMANPIPPRVVESGPVHEVVITGEELKGSGKGLEGLPVPISSPGFDAAPYLTQTCTITKDPETGVQNMGTYRGMLKSSDRLGMMMLVSNRAGGIEHWAKHNKTRDPMPMAIVLGAPPLVAFLGPQRYGTGWTN